KLRHTDAPDRSAGQLHLRHRTTPSRPALGAGGARLRSRANQSDGPGTRRHFLGGLLIMKYMLLIYMQENAMSQPEREQCYVDSTRLAQDLHAKGQFVSANPLQPVSTAASVRIRDGQRVVTDGPFAETREHLGGYFLVEAKD